MSLLQSPLDQIGTDIFSALPPELNIKILDRASFPDMRRLISASPTVLNIFRKHRSYLLGDYLRDLLLLYGDDSVLPLVAFTMNLRLFRSHCQQLTASEVEETLKPAMDSVLLLEFTRPPLAGFLNLPIIEKAQKLLPELCHVFEIHQNATRGIKSLKDEPYNTKFRYIERFLRFDCYCSLFYHQGQYLFDGMNQTRNMFFQPFPLQPTVQPGWQYWVSSNSNGVVNAILHGHSRLLDQLDQSLRSRQPEPLKRHETWKRDVLRLRRNQFVNRRKGAKRYYLFQLCMGGFPRLLLLAESHARRL